jgi:hypothetical protein
MTFVALGAGSAVVEAEEDFVVLADVLDLRADFENDPSAWDGGLALIFGRYGERRKYRTFVAEHAGEGSGQCPVHAGEVCVAYPSRVDLNEHLVGADIVEGDLFELGKDIHLPGDEGLSLDCHDDRDRVGKEGLKGYLVS